MSKPVVKIVPVPTVDHDVLWGYVYGHPRFDDGTLVHTSLVVSRAGNTVETLNTIYEIVEEAPRDEQV